jgi:hypothetical protein
VAMYIKTTEVGQRAARDLLARQGLKLGADVPVQLLVEEKAGKNGVALLVDGERRGWVPTSAFPVGSFEEIKPPRHELT